MVLEKDQKLQEKVIVSDANNEVDSDNSGEMQKMHGMGLDNNVFSNNANGEKKIFKASNKKKM